MLLEQQPCASSSSCSQSAARVKINENTGTSPRPLSDLSSQSLTGAKTDTSDSNRPRLPVVCCFGCGEQGHQQASCPKAGPRALFMEDVPVYDEEPDDSTTNITEEILPGDSGMALVIHRTCLLPQGMEESWLRSNIFRSSCTIRGKVCKFIIDLGSCTNVI